MVVDEEGLIKNKPVNLIGSTCYGTVRYGSPIVGDIVIMREECGDDGMDLASLTESDITLLAPRFQRIIDWRQAAAVKREGGI